MSARTGTRPRLCFGDQAWSVLEWTRREYGTRLRRVGSGAFRSEQFVPLVSSPAR
jgi:hypothetical protein